MSTAPPPPPPEEPRPRIQFSMATLMGTVTLIAVGLTLIVALPAWVGVLFITILRVGFLIFLIAGAFFAKGNRRTFCIGAIATQFLMQDFMVIRYSAFSPNSILRDNLLLTIANEGINLGVVLLGGWFCVRARRFWEHYEQ